MSHVCWLRKFIYSFIEDSNTEVASWKEAICDNFFPQPQNIVVKHASHVTDVIPS